MDRPRRALEFIDLKTQQDAIRADLERGIHRVLHHGQYILGPEIAELEAALAEYVGVQHGITVASGTDSLEIALRALGIGPGAEVITVPFTWISSAEVIGLVGATPVFVDIEPDSFNIGNTHVYAQYTIRVAERERVADALKAHGIPTAVYDPKCLHEQPVFEPLGYRWGDFPEAERASREVLSLPMHPGLTERGQDRVVSGIRTAVG